MTQETAITALSSANTKNPTREEIILDTLQEDDEHNVGWLVALAGVAAGIVGVATVNIGVGGFVFAMITGTSFFKQMQKGKLRSQILHGEVSPIALMRSQEELEEYKKVVGEEHFAIELQKVGDSYKMGDEQSQQIVQAAKIAYAPKYNPVEELADYFDKNVMVLGISGDGKDFLCSNSIRIIKRSQTQLNIFVIDPKGDSRESGYYESVANVFRSKQCGEVSDEQAILWFRQSFEEWKEASKDPNQQWLLLITETTLTGAAFARQKDSYLEEAISKQVTTGSSFGKYLWILAQNPNLAKLGIDSDSRAQFHTFAVVHRKSASKAIQWHRVTAKIKKIEIEMLCDNSPVKRCFYCPATGEWHVMPKLDNHSTFDRDTRTRIQPASAPETPTPTTTTPTAIQSESPTKLQTSQDDIDRLLDALDQMPTGDGIVDALKTLDPNIPNDRLTAVVQVIKTEAIARNRPHILSKFSL